MICQSFLFFMVPEIGVEPTRREALAPETSVSTISPLGLAKVGQRYKMFLNYELNISQISSDRYIEMMLSIPLSY